MATRETKPQQLTNLIAAIYQVYPGANLDPDSIAEIMPLIREELARGRSVGQVVRQLCSCDGKKVFPSEGARRRIGRVGKLAVSAVTDRLPTKGELQEPATLLKLRQQLAKIKKREVELTGGIALLRLDPKKAATAARAETRLTAVTARKLALQQRLSVLLSVRPWAAPVVDDEGEAQEAQTSSPQKVDAPRRKRKPKQSAPAEAPTVPQASEPSTDDDDFDGLLNALAKQGQ